MKLSKMKWFIVCLLMFSSTVGLAQEIRDPNVEVRDVPAFQSIKISDAIDLFLSQSDEQVVAVSATDLSYRGNIRTSVQDGVLNISFDSKGIRLKRGNVRLRAYVSISQLRSLRASGACDITISGTLKGQALDLDMSGASDIKGEVDLASLELRLSGASRANISGLARELSVDGRGASDLRGYGLETENCTANVSGASSVQITVQKELNAKAAGASSLSFKGTAMIRDIKTSGASSISRKT